MDVSICHEALQFKPVAKMRYCMQIKCQQNYFKLKREKFTERSLLSCRGLLGFVK